MSSNGLNISLPNTRAFGGIKRFEIMDKQEIIRMPSFPVYLPQDKYDVFKKLCKAKRMPMTKIAEQEIDKFIKRETPQQQEK
jgi:hypothetical protein